MLRFAPSPTGDMHISNLRVAILNYLVSQQKNDDFLVRIEDTDTQRNIEGKDTEIMMLLEKFALKHDTVFHQTEHLKLHQTLALRLLKEEKAFVCKCSEEELTTEHCSGHCEDLTPEDYTALKNSGKPFVVRIKKPKEDILFQDMFKGEIRASINEIDSFIILKEDGTASYNFASASDDMMSNIDFIIQQEAQLENVAKQIHIQNCLGYEGTTQYAHIPTILNNETSSVKWLFEEGFIPDAILNYLLLIGNSNIAKEIFTLPDAVQWFDLNNISKFPVTFEIEKLRFINREHLKLMNNRQLSTLFGFADEEIGKLAKLYLEECSTINELEAKVLPIFKPKNFSNEWAESMKIIENIIFEAPAFETLDELQKHITAESGLNGDNLMKPLRHLLTNTDNGPELSEIYTHIKAYILEVAS
jgi:glutamyl-tRNA synthetase